MLKFKCHFATVPATFSGRDAKEQALTSVHPNSLHPRLPLRPLAYFNLHLLSSPRGMGLQPQPPVPERRAPGESSAGPPSNVAGTGGGRAVAAAGTTSATARRREGGGGGGAADESSGGGNPLLLSFASADTLYRQAKEVGGFVTTGSDRWVRVPGPACSFLVCAYLHLQHVDEPRFNFTGVFLFRCFSRTAAKPIESRLGFPREK